ncbi:DUF1365 domain-containing protein [Nereida sp. MMG025]|uniref:DUF1365 domain-containing protein n=1 Tax=Nereida sp. MMG025 TaxID=2909981 RepID=UPI001F2B4965|nr:DUF1365 domain-containing protein [Nereida sp. MMG025]MCF6444858.1 DUF1365 domain-containing protein [Nereida sp. MMG025]
MAQVQHIKGKTYHGRKGEQRNAFRYSVDYVAIDPEAEVKTPLLFSRNGRGVTALHDADHGGDPKKGRGAKWVRDVIASNKLPCDGRIELLAQPRVLGHVFNPVSFWLCHDTDDNLRVVIAEVTNTFGDRHSYLCHRDDLEPITPQDTLHASKIFHVSPFQPVKGGYAFKFDFTGDHIGVRIDFTAGNGGVIATLAGKREPLTNASIMGMLVRRPLGSRRVLGLIHWQAFKLWWKGAGYRARPEPPKAEVTR